VSNLPYFSRSEDLRRLFTDAGFAPVTCDKKNSTKCRRISTGEVSMRTPVEAWRAVERLNGATVKGRSVLLSLVS